MQSSHTIAIPRRISHNDEMHEFPMGRYKVAASFVAASVFSALPYSVFLGDTAINSGMYLLQLENTKTNNFLVAIPLIIPVVGNLVVDYLCVPVAREASEIAQTKTSKIDVLLNRNQASYLLRKITKASYYSLMLAALPAYSSLSTADGVSFGWLLVWPGIVYPGAIIFAFTGTIYYHSLLNNRRADHVVSYLARLVDGKNSMLLDMFTQPLMTGEAINEISITLWFRIMLAVYTVFVFLTETLNIDSGNPLVLKVMATTALSALLDAITTRTKSVLEQAFKYSELRFIDGWIHPSKGALLTLTRTELKAINNLISKKEMGFNFILSAVRGTAIGMLCKSYGVNFSEALGIGSIVLVHALYAKWMRLFCEAVVNAKKTPREIQAATEEKTDRTERVVLFNNIVKQCDSDKLKNKIFWLNVLARFARFVAFPWSIVAVNQELQDHGVYEALNMHPFDFQQVLALWILIGIPYFSNEWRLYQTALEESIPEQIARISMERHHRYSPRAGCGSRVSGYIGAFFRPAETYNKDYLKVEQQRLDVAAGEQKEESPSRTSACSRCVIC